MHSRTNHTHSFYHLKKTEFHYRFHEESQTHDKRDHKEYGGATREGCTQRGPSDTQLSGAEFHLLLFFCSFYLYFFTIFFLILFISSASERQTNARAQLAHTFDSAKRRQKQDGTEAQGPLAVPFT